jgi:L-ribulose-5-phosphate 3-epimerase
MDFKGDDRMLGVMQGRLSPQIGSKIQAFPKSFWKAEFFLAEAIGAECVEWTLDFEDIYENPIISDTSTVLDIKMLTNVAIPSLTYDVGMQKPLVVDGLIDVNQVELLGLVLDKIKKVGVEILVLPLVDNSSIKNNNDLDLYITVLKEIAQKYLTPNLKIAIESDFPPNKLIKFINKIDTPFIGINYDTGNSSAIGFDFYEEMISLKSRILNIHIKDRKLNGPTVALGKGSAPLEKQVKYFKNELPNVNLILQPARSECGNDVGLIEDYLKFLQTGTLL